MGSLLAEQPFSRILPWQPFQFLGRGTIDDAAASLLSISISHCSYDYNLYCLLHSFVHMLLMVKVWPHSPPQPVAFAFG